MSLRRFAIPGLAAAAALVLVSYWRMRRRERAQMRLRAPSPAGVTAKQGAGHAQGIPLQPWRVVAGGRPLSVPDAFWDAGLALEGDPLESSDTNGSPKRYSNGVRRPRNDDTTG